MSTGTSLVHPDTAKLTPNEQKKGIYEYTPPEVVAFYRGEYLTHADLEIVRSHFGGDLPDLSQVNPPDAVSAAPANPAPRRVEASPALAAPYGQPQRKLKKVRPQPSVTPLDAAYTLVAALDDDAAFSLFCHLAGRFEYDME